MHYTTHLHTVVWNGIVVAILVVQRVAHKQQLLKLVCVAQRGKRQSCPAKTHSDMTSPCCISHL